VSPDVPEAFVTELAIRQGERWLGLAGVEVEVEGEDQVERGSSDRPGQAGSLRQSRTTKQRNTRETHLASKILLKESGEYEEANSKQWGEEARAG